MDLDCYPGFFIIMR